MVPSIWFPSKRRASRLIRLAKLDGIEPVKLLPSKTRDVRLVMLLRNIGTGPVKLLLPRKRSLRSPSFEKVVGIVPLSIFWVKDRNVSEEKSPIDAGSVPAICSLGKFRLVNSKVTLSQPTPGKLHSPGVVVALLTKSVQLKLAASIPGSQAAGIVWHNSMKVP